MLLAVVVMGLCGSSAAAPIRLSAPDGTVKEVPAESVDYARKDGYARFPQVYMRVPDEKVSTIGEDLVPAAEGIGYWRMTSAEVAAQHEFEKNVTQQ